VTIHNEDLGFLPGGIRSFPNGRVLPEPTGDFGRTYLSVQRSQDLREWQDLPSIGIQPDRRFEVLDRDARTGEPWFYRLVGDQ
jgi:hypothetical protein